MTQDETIAALEMKCEFLHHERDEERKLRILFQVALGEISRISARALAGSAAREE